MPDTNSNHSLTTAQNMTDIAQNALFCLLQIVYKSLVLWCRLFASWNLPCWLRRSFARELGSWAVDWEKWQLHVRLKVDSLALLRLSGVSYIFLLTFRKFLE